MTRATGTGTLAVLTLIAALTACGRVSETRTTGETIDPGGATAADVLIKMGAGELELTGGGAHLMDATFTTNVRRWEPRVDYDVFGGKGRLSVRQRRFGGLFLGNAKNEWTIRLGGGLPIDLGVDLGAGESALDLRGLDLGSLEIDMGVGEMTLDLSGPRTRSLRVSIDGGIGRGTILLPRDVGVKVDIDGGLGSIEARGLERTGRKHVYTNDAWDRSDVRVEIEIDAGIGSIELKVI
ncbi:MAG: hypothetical protein JW742_09530 [Candidatus Aminicenantes bacterium]|nr:hypothetical protein [Candidatus Aminicenantes bacterium]